MNILKDDDTLITEKDDELHEFLNRQDNIELLLLNNTILYRKVFKYKYKSRSFDLIYSLRKRLRCGCNKGNKYMKVNLSKLLVFIEEVSCLKCGKNRYINQAYCYIEYEYLHKLFTRITRAYVKNYIEKDMYTIHLVFKTINLYYPHVYCVM